MYNEQITIKFKPREIPEILGWNQTIRPLEATLPFLLNGRVGFSLLFLVSWLIMGITHTFLLVCTVCPKISCCEEGEHLPNVKQHLNMLKHNKYLSIRNL